MSKKILAAILASAFVSTAAFAEDMGDSFYVRADVGGSIGTYSNKFSGTNYKVSPNNSVVFGLGLGYQFNSNFRTDVTINYRPSYKLSINDGSTGTNTGAKLRTWVGMVNAYYDIGTYSLFTPYLTAGLGFSSLNAQAFNYKGVSLTKYNKTSFAWGVGAGTALNLGNGLAADLSYKFQGLGRLKEARLSSGSVNLYTHDITVGLRYNF